MKSPGRLCSRYLATIAMTLVAAVLVFVSAGVARSDEIDTLFDQGTAAIKQGDFKTAHEKLSKAWQGRQTFDIAANLAQAERRLGKNRDAAEHLAYALAHVPVTADEGLKRQLTAALAEAKKRVCELKITAEEGATVKIDGKTVGLAPLALPAYVEPGEHVLQAEKGARKGEVELTSQAGASERVEIPLAASSSAWGLPTASASASGSAAPSASAAPSSSIPPPPDNGPPKWPGFVVGGLGVVGVAIGGGLMGAGAGAKSDAEESASGIAGPCPSAPTTGPCKELADDFENADTLSNAGLGTLIAGSAVLATGIVLIAWSYATGGPAPDESAFLVLPVVGREQSGIFFQSRF